MDLSNLDTATAADQGADLELLSPIDDSVLRDEATGEPVTIKLLGSDSKDFMKISHKIQERRLQRRFSGGKKVKFSPQEIEADGLELLVACTKGWKHIVIDKQPLAYSESNVRMLYTRFPWIREQVDTFINERANFLGEF